jgi:cell division protein FtsX
LLLGAGAVAAWYGLVEGFRIAFLGALLAWGAAVVLMFSGGAKPASEAVDRNDDATMQTIGLVALVVAAIAAGAAGVWYALVDDVKIGFALGLPVMAVATVTAFRGKLTA